MKGILAGIALLALDCSIAHAQSAGYFKLAWSPDSRTIAFESTREGEPAIYTIRVDGSGLKKLTTGDAENIQPSWSPDGQRIVFASTRAGHEQLYIMNADGTQPVRLTNDDGSSDFNPAFSRDGQWIVFQAQQRQPPQRYTIQMMRADGSARRLISDTAYVSTTPRWVSDTTITFFRTPICKPEWKGLAPRDLVAARARAEERVTLQVDRASGSFALVHVQPCCSLQKNHDGPSPDGRWFAYTRTGEQSGIYLLELATQKERALITSR